jgi:cell wall-associated NlpC family hydrolase
MRQVEKRKDCGCNRRAKGLNRTARKGHRTKTLAQRRAEIAKAQQGQPPKTEPSYRIASPFGETTAADFQTELDQWLAVPFRHMGESEYGTDCIGLVLAVYKRLGLIPSSWRPTEYSRQWYLTDNVERHPAFEQLKQGLSLRRIDDPKELRAGDILCFAFGKGIEAHVGLLSSRGSIVHAVAGEQADKVIESRFDDNRWRKRFVYGYRITTNSSAPTDPTENVS